MEQSRYRRAMAPLDAEARARLWESGGAAPAAGTVGGGSVELDELVRAFYNDEAVHRIEAAEEKERPASNWLRELEAVLRDAAAAEPVAEWIQAKAEAAVWSGGMKCAELARRRLVCRMIDGGLDAGICESRWDSTAGIPAGSHEYIDVLFGESRYIVEISLAGEFEIARPTTDYTELLGNLPRVFVGSPATLEAVIRLMCLAAQESIKNAGMHVPPWRRQKYMREKWFGNYRRRGDSSSSLESRGLAIYASRHACRANSAGTEHGSKLVEDMFLKGM